MTTFLPGILPSIFTYRWAVPAEYMPAGRKPGMLSAPLERSLHPMARITAFASIRNIPRSLFITVITLSSPISTTIVCSI